MIECKSADDFANVNKRRKEEATKMQQLKVHLAKMLYLICFCVAILIQLILDMKPRKE